MAVPKPPPVHSGFYIPNANDASNPRMAEPDRIDFNTLAHPLWGVVEGCSVWVTTTMAQTGGGTAIVNGQLVAMSPGAVNLGTGGSQDRFDLIVCNSGGMIDKVVGEYSVDPVFPDPPADVTVLAAVFAPAGAPNLSANVIDKRKFVNKALLTKIGVGESLVRNVNGSGNHFLVDGGGKTTWEGDTWMERTGPESLKIHRNLALEGSVTADGTLTVNGAIHSVTDAITGANFHWSLTPPTNVIGSSLWQNPDTSRVYLWRNGGWKEMATIESANPPGTVITSLEDSSVMIDLGWLPLDGRRVTEDVYPSLFTVKGLSHRIRNTVPREMNLPDAQKLMLVTDFMSKAGEKVSPNPGNQVTLTTTNLPSHGHSPQSEQGGAANLSASTSQAAGHVHGIHGGSHDHTVTELGHRHQGMEFGLGSGIAAPVVALMWGGQNKIDALFNDRNHTYSVEAMDWSMPAVSGLTVNTSGGHQHSMEAAGAHDHTVNISGLASHNHTITETLIGNSTPFNITPEYLTVFSYIRT